MTIDYGNSILWHLRQIIRSIDKHNKQLSRSCQLTVPQLVCLRMLLNQGPRPIGQLAAEVCLSKATLTGIVDRLENKGLVHRDRSTSDRRKIMLKLTPQGEDMARSMPWPLQERFQASLKSLSLEEIQLIDDTLQKVLEMMEAPAMEVWPFGGEDAVPPDMEIMAPEPKDTTDE